MAAAEEEGGAGDDDDDGDAAGEESGGGGKAVGPTKWRKVKGGKWMKVTGCGEDGVEECGVTDDAYAAAAMTTANKKKKDEEEEEQLEGGQGGRFSDLSVLLASDAGFDLSEHSCGLICANALNTRRVVYDLPNRRVALLVDGVDEPVPCTQVFCAPP